MKRIIFIYLSLLIFGSLFAQTETTDTCSISVEKRGKSFLIRSTTQDKVFVRKPGNGDNRWYIFISSPILELDANNDTTNTFFLCGGFQEGKINCWYMRPQDKKPREDKDDKHQMAPIVRRNWLIIKSLSTATEVDVKFEGTDSTTALLNIRKFPGWAANSLNSLKIKYTHNVQETDHAQEEEKYFMSIGNEIITDTINLAKETNLSDIALVREGKKYNFMIQSVQFDGQKIPFTFQRKESSKVLENQDDLMFDGQINVSLPDEELQDGVHELVFDAIALTDKGPKHISLKVPVSKQSAKLFSTPFNIKYIVAFLLLLCITYLIWKYFTTIKTIICRISQFEVIDKNKVEAISKEKEELEETVRELGDENKLLTEKNQELTEKNLEVNKMFEDISKKYRLLEENNAAQEQAIKDLEANSQIVTEDFNPALLSEVESLRLQLENIQSTLDNSNKRLTITSNQLQEKNAQIINLEDETKKLASQKNVLEQKCHKIEKELSGFEAHSQEEIKTIKEKAKEEKQKLREKYKKELEEKDRAMELLVSNHHGELERQQQKSLSDLEHQKETHRHETNQLEEQHQKEIKKLETQYKDRENKLKKIISDMGKDVNVGRDILISQVSDRISNAMNLIHRLRKDIGSAPDPSSVVISTVELMISDIEKMKNNFEKNKKEVWTQEDIDIESVTESIQQLFVRALRTKGWMNHAGLLLCYSRIPQLCELLEQKGISPSVLEQLYAQTSAMLGSVNMAMNIPAILATAFSEEAYEYENGDIWIDKFFPQFTRTDYSGKIYDIIRVGFIKDGEIKKPVVVF